MYCDYFMCRVVILRYCGCFFFKQKTAYEVRISDWSSDVCSSDLEGVCDRLAVPSHQGAAGVLVALYLTDVDLTGWEDRCGLPGPFSARLVTIKEQHELIEAVEPLVVVLQDVQRAFSPCGDRDDRVLAACRSEERSVGKECVSTCRSRGSP